MMELSKLSDIALRVAQEAGDVVLSGWRSRFSVEKKGRTDLVTQYDLASERHIRNRLSELSPGIPIVAEELGGVLSAGRRWVCDPIDGTTNFVHGHPIWSISVGLVEDGVPVAGAVVAPALRLEWSGWVGGGAKRCGVPCTVSRTPSIVDALVATGFPYDGRDIEPSNNFGSFIRVKRAVRAVRRCGSAAIDMCFTADGTYDAYWERHLKPWDVAAGAAILMAAGGRWTALDGGAPDLREGHLLSSNGLLHEALIPLILGGHRLE
jgi:myo-inositol-1(or 4)-monophosphatase